MDNDKAYGELLKAMEAHGEQMWGEFPYRKHLLAVYQISKILSGNDTKTLMVAAYHDALEDTDLKESDLPEAVRVPVRQISRNLSQGDETYQEYIQWLVDHAEREAVVVKLADAIANWSLCRNNGGKLISRYEKSIPVLWRAVFDEPVDWVLIEEFRVELDF